MDLITDMVVFSARSHLVSVFFFLRSCQCQHFVTDKAVTLSFYDTAKPLRQGFSVTRQAAAFVLLTLIKSMRRNMKRHLITALTKVITWIWFVDVLQHFLSTWSINTRCLGMKIPLVQKTFCTLRELFVNCMIMWVSACRTLLQFFNVVYDVK